MTDQSVPSVRPQPMIAVADVGAASRWYQQVLGAGKRPRRRPTMSSCLSTGTLIMQLHRLDAGHHHGTIADPQQPVGNGLALWFEADGFDAAVRRMRAVSAQVVTDGPCQPPGRPPRGLDPRP